VSDEEMDEFRRRLAEASEAAGRLPPGSDEELQDELGLIVQLLPGIARSQDLSLLRNIELAIQALLAQPPNRLLAIRLREACEGSILRRSFLRSILPGTSASTWVIYGMFGQLYIVIPVCVVLILGGSPGSSFQTGLEVAVAGALGSVVSILVRITDFAEIRVLNPPGLFWTGFFKPIIGACFALFVYSTFKSGLLEVNQAVNSTFLYLSLGFAAGFSERFAPDLVSRVERTIGPSEPPRPNTSKETRP
jgi:hypothetical protein